MLTLGMMRMACFTLWATTVTARYIFARSTIEMEFGYLENDFSAGRSHMTWSFSCLVGEALLLKRALVMPDRLTCLPPHCEERHDDPLSWFFRRNESEVVLESELPQNISIRDLGCNVTTADLALPPFSTYPAVRWANRCHPYGFQRCEPDPRSKALSGGIQIRRRYSLRPPLQAIEVIKEIKGKMNPKAGAANGAAIRCMHVRRGDKLLSHRCLDKDTSPSTLNLTLRHMGVPPGTVLYIATNEANKSFFDPLRQEQGGAYDVYTLHDFRHLIQRRLPNPYYAGVIVDYHLCNDRIKKTNYAFNRNRMIDTFEDLTTDCKDGSAVSKRGRYACMTPNTWSQPHTPNFLRSSTEWLQSLPAPGLCSNSDYSN